MHSAGAPFDKLSGLRRPTKGEVRLGGRLDPPRARFDWENWATLALVVRGLLAEGVLLPPGPIATNYLEKCRREGSTPDPDRLMKILLPWHDQP